MNKSLSEDLQFTGFVDLLRCNWLETILLLIALLTGVYYDWTLPESLIFVLFIFAILKPISSRLFAVPALIFLILVPLLLHFNNQVRAEEFAIYAYYFLVIAVMRGILELKNEER